MLPALVWLLSATALVVAFSGCMAVGSKIPADPSFAFSQPEATRLGRGFAAGQADHPGRSGFTILDYGLEALLARAAAADAAERTIDAQYYIYDHDEAGSLLTERLILAADRGARIRLLLDDFNLGHERELIALCAHPRIQIRVFNPVARALRWAHPIDYLFSFNRADRRMHNKLFIVDNEVVIMGGRNVGNDYFNVRAASPFRDFDVLAVGPIAGRASATFDQFWNSHWSVPAVELLGRSPRPADLVWLRRRISLRARRAPFYSNFEATKDHYLSSLEGVRGGLTWADGEIVSDSPEKADGDSAAGSQVARRLDKEYQAATKEVLIEAAYFVPGGKELEAIRQLRRRGVAVRVLTSAANATDAPVVQCSYRELRPGLLQEGVELHEFRMRSASSHSDRQWYHARPPYAALHSKVMVFDRRTAWIGSFNLDPRSAHLNTEIVAIVHSPRFSQQLAAAILDDCLPDRSWRIRLASDGDAGPKSASAIVWLGEVRGHPVRLRHEPMSLGRRLKMFFLSLLPGIRGEI